MSSRIIWSNFRNYLTISNRLNQPKFNTIQYNKFNNFSSYSTGNNVGTVNFNNSEINKEKIKLTLGRGKLGGELGGELAEGEIVARRLDNEGYFFLKNLRRLKPFLKFLLFQSIPILLLMFLYKYFEQKKLTSIAPITTESELTKHVISSIRNATSVLISSNNFTFVNNIKLSNISEDIQSLLSPLSPVNSVITKFGII